jgi:hypothetical protein
MKTILLILAIVAALAIRVHDKSQIEALQAQVAGAQAARLQAEGVATAAADCSARLQTTQAVLSNVSRAYQAARADQSQADGAQQQTQAEADAQERAQNEAEYARAMQQPLNVTTLPAALPEASVGDQIKAQLKDALIKKAIKLLF